MLWQKRVAISLVIFSLAQGCSSHSAQTTPTPRGGEGTRQWEPARRLTFGGSSAQLSYHFTRSLATDQEGRVHVVWYDTRDGTPQIYYKRSRDNGTTWGPEIHLSPNASPQEQPAIAADGRSVYVVWHDMRSGYRDVYLKRSVDGGETWGPEMLLSVGGDLADSMYPAVAVSGAHVHVTFADNRDGPVHVFYTRSTDGGVTWFEDHRLSDNLPSDSWTPSVAVAGEAVYAIWTDTRDGNEEEYFKRSTDGGVTWGPDTRLTYDGVNSWAPVLEVTGQTVHLVWFSQKESAFQPYDAEKKIDELLASMGLPVTPEPRGVVLVRSPKSTKERVEVKRRKIQLEATSWVQHGGDQTQLERLVREFEQLNKPTVPFEAEKQLDQAMRLVGLPAQPAPPGAEVAYDLNALRLRTEEKMRKIETAVPAWVHRSGDMKQLRATLDAYNRLAHFRHPSEEDKERKLDEALQLMGLAFVPEQEVTRVYYLDDLQKRLREKVQQMQAALPSWVQRGGRVEQLEATLRQVEHIFQESMTEWAVYYRRSMDGGMTWDQPVRLTEIPGSCRRPDLAVAGQEVHVVWVDASSGREGVYYRSSVNGGTTWNPAVRLVSLKAEWGIHPAVEASGDFVHVLWVDQPDGPPEVYYERQKRTRIVATKKTSS